MSVAPDEHCQSAGQGVWQDQWWPLGGAAMLCLAEWCSALLNVWENYVTNSPEGSSGESKYWPGKMSDCLSWCGVVIFSGCLVEAEHPRQLICQASWLRCHGPEHWWKRSTKPLDIHPWNRAFAQSTVVVAAIGFASGQHELLSTIVNRWGGEGPYQVHMDVAEPMHVRTGMCCGSTCGGGSWPAGNAGRPLPRWCHH